MWRVAGKALPGEVEGFVDATSEEVGVSIQPSGVCLEPLDVSRVVGGQTEIAEHVVEGTVLHDKHHDGVDQVERGHGSTLLSWTDSAAGRRPLQAPRLATAPVRRRCADGQEQEFPRRSL